MYSTVLRKQLCLLSLTLLPWRLLITRSLSCLLQIQTSCSGENIHQSFLFFQSSQLHYVLLQWWWEEALVDKGGGYGTNFGPFLLAACTPNAPSCPASSSSNSSIHPHPNQAATATFFPSLPMVTGKRGGGEKKLWNCVQPHTPNSPHSSTAFFFPLPQCNFSLPLFQFEVFPH